MKWNVAYSDEFGEWWQTLSEEMQEDIRAIVMLLEEKGPQLTFPFSTGVSGSQYSHMRELRIQSKSDPVRILYAFDPKRTAILLIGGNKRGDNRWYKKNIPLADKIYAKHLNKLKERRLL